MNEISYYIPVISALLVPGAIVLVTAIAVHEYKSIPRHRRRKH